jgi:arylsulfatase A-like enzyme
MTKTVRQCDEHLGYLLDQIDANKNLHENLHLIVTSDHGMEQINGTENPLYIENYIDETKVKAFGVPPAMNIFVQSGKKRLFIEINDCFFFVFFSR